jgi:lipid-A-disaccharide synthase-like uncharacterized protein
MDQVMAWANVEEPWELWVLGFGVIAQMTFFCRWIVQWIATERRGVSHVPELFWWLSLAGATLLLAYFTLRGEPIGMLGQLVGWLVYSRNLYFVRVKHKEVAEESG